MKLDDYRLKLGDKEYVPIVIGGMGVNISTSALALEAARLGGIGHISDAINFAVADKAYGTNFIKNKREGYQDNINKKDKSGIKFNLDEVAKAQKLQVAKTMEAKKGQGAIFINCMEKLTMGNAEETMRVRLSSAMEAGIEGITLGAGLHLKSLALVEDHPRFRDVKFGIIVSSCRALKLFLRRAAKTNRMPDYIVVEGPLAGGHLGFDLNNWQQFNLRDIVKEILFYLDSENLNIPVIPAGGIFTGTDAVDFIKMGAKAVQVATRFTVTEESGFPTSYKQEYFKSEKEDVIVSSISPTGYPIRILRQTPGLNSGMVPNCEALGYLLNNSGKCSYIEEYYKTLEANPGKKVVVKGKVCLCTLFQNYRCWTCGQNVYRLKDTTRKLPDGSYKILTVEHVFKDYQYSEDHNILLPE